MNLRIRLLSIIILVSGTIYILSLINLIRNDFGILRLIFILLQIIIFLIQLIHIKNNWTARITEKKTLKGGYEKKVAIIIPTWSEPVEMVERTILSILKQNYPSDKLMIIVTDDSNNSQMEEMVIRLAHDFNLIEFAYNIPPKKDSIYRIGEGKAGNLNSAFELVKNREDIEYVETRDADDLVGSATFIRECLGHLELDKRIAFVQTKKTVFHSPGDPFGNKEELFYSSLMLAKYSANAIFPCGSGLIWRKEALIDIGGFPAWNLVEDFQSGAEALRRGWESVYAPTLGAVGQIAPEDIPNMFKQRATWAMDSMRFLFWGNKKGMNFNQRLHFNENALAYIFSICIFFTGFYPAINLLTSYKVVEYADIIGIITFYLTYHLCMFLYPYMLSLRMKISLISLIRSFQILFGLGPLFLTSLIKVLAYGRNNKPKYIVTRKQHTYGVYLYKVIPQLFLVMLLIAGMIKHLITIEDISHLDLLTITWSCFYIFIYQRIIRNSWFKWNKK